MHWQKFQEITAQVFKQAGCCAEENAAVEGARSKHNVDVLVTFENYGFESKWAVECKSWNSNVTKEKVLALRSIVDDVGADKGLIVCKKNFQSGAVSAANKTNIELVSFSELEQVIASSVVPFVSTSKALNSSNDNTFFASDCVLKKLRISEFSDFPEEYRSYLLMNHCQKTQKAAARGLSKIELNKSVLLLVERLGDFWGMGAIQSCINALSRLNHVGGVLGIFSTLFLDDRFYYEKLFASAKALKKSGDTLDSEIIQSILNEKISEGISSSYRLSKQVPEDIELLLKCRSLDVVYGITLANFYNQSLWADNIEIEITVEQAIDYAQRRVEGLVNTISNIDFIKKY